MSSLIKWITKKFKGNDSKAKVEDRGTSERFERFVQSERKYNVTGKTGDSETSTNCIRPSHSQYSKGPIQNENAKEKEYCLGLSNNTSQDLYGVPSLGQRAPTSSSPGHKARIKNESMVCLNVDLSGFQQSPKEMSRRGNSLEHVDTFHPVSHANGTHSSSLHDNPVSTSDTFQYKLEKPKPSMMNSKADETFRLVTWTSWDNSSHQHHKPTARGANVRSPSSSNYAADKVFGGYGMKVNENDGLASTDIKKMDENQITFTTENIESKRRNDPLEQRTKVLKESSVDFNSSLQNDSDAGVSSQTVEHKAEERYGDLQYIAKDESKVKTKLVQNPGHETLRNIKAPSNCQVTKEKVENKVTTLPTDWQAGISFLINDVTHKTRQTLKHDFLVIRNSEQKSHLPTDTLASGDSSSVVMKDILSHRTNVCLVEDRVEIASQKKDSLEDFVLRNNDSIMIEPSLLSAEIDKGRGERYRFDTKNMNNGSNGKANIHSDISKLSVKSKVRVGKNENYIVGTNEDSENESGNSQKFDTAQVPYSTGLPSYEKPFVLKSQLSAMNKHLNMEINHDPMVAPPVSTKTETNDTVEHNALNVNIFKEDDKILSVLDKDDTVDDILRDHTTVCQAKVNDQLSNKMLTNISQFELENKRYVKPDDESEPTLKKQASNDFRDNERREMQRFCKPQISVNQDEKFINRKQLDYVTVQSMNESKSPSLALASIRQKKKIEQKINQNSSHSKCSFTQEIPLQVKSEVTASKAVQQETHDIFNHNSSVRELENRQKSVDVVKSKPNFEKIYTKNVQNKTKPDGVKIIGETSSALNSKTNEQTYDNQQLGTDSYINCEQLNVKIIHGMKLKPPKCKNITDLSESYEIKASDCRIKSDTGIQEYKKVDFTNFDPLSDEMVNGHLKLQKCDEEDREDMCTSSRLEMSGRKLGAQKSNSMISKIGARKKTIPKQEDLAFEAALKVKSQNSNDRTKRNLPAYRKTLERYTSEEANIKDTSFKTCILDDQTIVSNKGLSNKGTEQMNAEVLLVEDNTNKEKLEKQIVVKLFQNSPHSKILKPEQTLINTKSSVDMNNTGQAHCDHVEQVQSNGTSVKLESMNIHVPNSENWDLEEICLCENKSRKADAEALPIAVTKCKPEKSEKTANTGSKPQVLEIEITNLETKDSNIKRFLLQRLTKTLKFTIKEIATIDRVTFVAVEFPSTNSAKQAKHLLQNSNLRSRTKVFCSLSNERKQNTKSQRLSRFDDKLAHVAEDLIVDHNVDLQNISTCLNEISSKKRKFQAIAQYQREKKETEALSSKLNEMEKQKAEFRSFLSSLYDNLETLKEHSEFDEEDLTNLETAFKIECDRFSNKLPIYARRTDIVKLIDKNQASVILGETGSGKSTQIVQYLYQTGRFSNGTIVCTQPRKVAAISLATHVAKEMASNVGHLVGYQVGLHTKKSKETKILYMTDHVLLNECLKDRLLTSFSCIVIDEAHERSIFTDLLLGMIKKCLPSRPDLRVVITSATIEPHIFVQFFGNSCPVLTVSGRTFPVDIEWSEEDCDDNYEEKTLIKTIDVHKTEATGDILAFLTSPLEVEKCCQKFKDRLGNRNDFVCLPLHGKLQANEQQQVFTSPPRGKRKVVFATNSAETSITIPGIKFVIDSGRIKEMQFDPKKNINSLVVTLVTKSSADQRSGRAGRVEPGKCFRLYSQKDYVNMHANSTPEILRINLGQALLKLLELSVDPMSFDFVESPPKDQMEKAMDMLESIGAVSDGAITDLGKWIAKLPFQPIFGVFVYDALKCNTGLEALVITACCGSGGSLFYRSGTQKEKTDADKIKIRFSHQGGDIMTMLNAYRDWHQQPERDKGKWCAQNYVNGKTIKAVRETVTEVSSILKKELQVKLEFKFNKPHDVDEMLQKMLFKTFKHNICYFLGHEKAGYHVIHKAHNVCLFPSSALPSLGLQPEWIVIEQVLNINRDYGVNATPVPAEWIDEGIKERWLKEFHMEKAEQQKVNLVLQVGLGDRCYRDFVGPRYSRVKKLELTLQSTYSQHIVIIDTDSKLGKICIYASSGLHLILKTEIDKTLVPIQTKYKAEKSEQYLCSTKQGTRVIMSAGCDIADILMSDEYKAVLIVSDPYITSCLSVEEVRYEFERYGEIENIEMFRYTKNKQRTWGKVTYKTMEQAENAVKLSKQEEISALPTGNIRNQNEHRFRAKLEWCRRPSKGSGFVKFSDSRFANNILRSCRSMVIGGTIANLSYAKNNNDQIFVGKLNKFVNEEVLKNSFLDKFKLSDGDLVRASIVRDKVNTSRQEFESIHRRIDAQLKNFVKDGKYSVHLKPTKPQDFTFLAFASFSKIEEGQKACRKLVENFRPNGEIITSTITLQVSLLVIKKIYEICSHKIKQTITKLNEQDGTEIRFKLLRNGNCSIDINCNHIETLHRCRSKLEKIIQGLKMTKAEFPNIHELFTRSGRYELKNTASQTKALIIDDYRILEIAIFGDSDQQQMALTTLQKYLYNLTLGITKTLTLKGPDKPYGVIKQMFMQFGIDLGKLKRDIKELNCLQVDLRNHFVSINGTSEAVDEAIVEVNKVVDHLRQTQNCSPIENEEDQCPICFMEIEDGEMYRLESCGHPFCNTCIVPQLESAVGNSDFPLTCCKEGCDELWSWQDLLNLSLKSGMSINSLVNRATNSYVAKHDKKYKYCISPDCPSIYRVTSVSDVFCCCECEARICTACHIQYHDGISCSMVKELKRDSSGIQIWLRKDPHNRKLCPSCGLPIEKISGCNNMRCAKCKRNICWVCLEHFKDDQSCYKHLSQEHGGFGGDYYL